ncbi:transmembrane protein 26-like [Amphiura filiformis]|uniref:transmembrane protein 26-like n=1 Tax=Amphiura filiformis TaxID=82378 RepID=UPI003B219335
MAIITTEIFIRAVGVRLIFFVHALVCTWRVVYEKELVSVDDQSIYWCLLLIPLLLLPECVLTLKFTKYGEWQTFRPCILIYLASVVPNIWLLEYHILQDRFIGPGVDGIMCSTKYTEDDEFDNLFRRNTTTVIEAIQDFVTHLGSDNWAIGLQQFLLFILIAGRLVLPRGSTDHKKLAHIVLFQIVRAADMLDFLATGLRNDEGLCLESVLIGVLVLWTVSLLQLPFHFQTTQIWRLSAVTHTAFTNKSTDRTAKFEVWEIVTVLIMQDGPFFCMRLLFLFYFNIFSQALLFYIAKNCLVVIIKMYRLWAILCVNIDEDGNRNVKLVTRIRATQRGRRSTGQSRDHKADSNVAPNEDTGREAVDLEQNEDNGDDIEINDMPENISSKNVTNTPEYFSRITIEDKSEDDSTPNNISDNERRGGDNQMSDKPNSTKDSDL